MNQTPSQTGLSLPTLLQRSKARALLTSACTLFAAFAGSAQAANMISQWNFDDVQNGNTATAHVGGYTGTFIGGTVTRSANGLGVSGTLGDYSLSLGGAGIPGARMDATSSDFLNTLNGLTGGQSISITYWQNLNAYTDSTSLWAQSASVARGLNAHSPWSDGNIYFDTAGCCTGGVHRLSGGLGASIGQWELITLIYDNGNKSIYRGTTLINSGSGFAALTADHTAFYIGNESPTHNLLPNAFYDNFTLWSGALSQPEIAELAVRPVPEPSTAILLGAGSLLAMRRRRK